MTEEQKNQNRPWCWGLQLALGHGVILLKADGWKGEVRMSKDARLGPPGEARISNRQTNLSSPNQALWCDQGPGRAAPRDAEDFSASGPAPGSTRSLGQLPVSTSFETGQEAEVRNGSLLPGLCDKGDVEFVCVEDQGSPGRAWVPVGLVQQLEEPSSNVHGDPHDDAFGHP